MQLGCQDIVNDSEQADWQRQMSVGDMRCLFVF